MLHDVSNLLKLAPSSNVERRFASPCHIFNAMVPSPKSDCAHVLVAAHALFIGLAPNPSSLEQDPPTNEHLILCKLDGRTVRADIGPPAALPFHLHAWIALIVSPHEAIPISERCLLCGGTKPAHKKTHGYDISCFLFDPKEFCFGLSLTITSPSNWKHRLSHRADDKFARPGFTALVE